MAARDAKAVAHQVLRGQALQQRGRRDLGADVLGQRDQAIRIDRHQFGVGVRHVGETDARAARETRIARGGRFDHARAFVAEDPGRAAAQVVVAVAAIDVGEVQADALDAHQRLARPRHGIGTLAPLQDFGAAESVEKQCVHGYASWTMDGLLRARLMETGAVVRLRERSASAR